MTSLLLLVTLCFVTSYTVATEETEAVTPHTEQASSESKLAITPAATSVYKVSTSVSHTERGTITQTESGIAAGSNRTITVIPKAGYGIEKLVVDGVSVGSKATYTFKNIKADHTIKAYFKTAPGYAYITLDAGHYGYYNQSPIYKSYWESIMNWKLHLYLKEELEAYKNVVVETTRATQTKDMPIYDRGRAAAKSDLFLSLHSNASGDKSIDYPLVITQKDKTKNALAVSFGHSFQTLMNTKQNYRIWQRLDSTGAEYYGVLRGAKSVGTEGMILEHSFHTNLAAAKWLSSNTNLQKMAKEEAANIASYYGLSKTESKVMPPSKTTLSISNGGYKGLKLSWKQALNASGYTLYRATSEKGAYKAIKTINDPSAAKYEDTSLATGSVYYYKIKAFKTVNGKNYTGKYSKLKSAQVKPAKPSISSKAGKKSITVEWNKVAGASGYHIYRATSKNGTYKLIKKKGSTARSYTNKKLKSKKTYYYKVRAYRLVNGKKIYSSYSSKTWKITR